MFLSIKHIKGALKDLEKINPFYGITFLSCKKNSLPIGKMTDYRMDFKNLKFLEEHHRLNDKTAYFYQPYKTSDKQKRWLRPDYPSSGLQAINTQTFSKAFLHSPGTRLWGWEKNYIEFLKSKIGKSARINIFSIATWIFREKQWPNGTSYNDIIHYFIRVFHITPEEQMSLFDVSIPSYAKNTEFQDDPVDWNNLSLFIQSPPDLGPDQGGTLSLLQLKNLGPVESLSFLPARRLNIVTGDNGLGKSFLLECAWWALTSVWAEAPAYPNKNKNSGESSITFEIAGKYSRPVRREITYETKFHMWPRKANRPTIPGLIVYARVDGSYAVWDPARFSPYDENNTQRASLVFTRNQVWDGLQGSIEGLIRDWIRWQSKPENSPFEVFKEVLKKMSPPDLGELVPGDPVRVPNDPRDIPTVVHPYAEVPIICESAGVRRIITMAYLIVWAWNEHLINSQLSREEPQNRMVVIIDEIEAHLHPKWQRSILPALLDVQKVLSSELEIQFFITTHSPLVMASSEPFFNEDIDQLFHLYIDDNKKVIFDPIEFLKYGHVGAWLTSPIFEMRHARSSEAEAAIEEAKKLQMETEINTKDVQNVTDKLLKYLSPQDQFWPRWVYYAEKHGVIL